MILVLQKILMNLLAFMLAITLHEFAHAIAADKLGDETPRLMGRVTINPLDHLDPVGTFVLIISSLAGFAFGWGRPVLVMKSKFRNPKTADILVALAGPMMNLVLAVICAVIVKTGYLGLPNSSPWHQFIIVALNLNILLFAFNLVPIPPLDGAQVLADSLPEQKSVAYQKAMGKWGWVLLFLAIYFGGIFVGPELSKLHTWLNAGHT